MIGCTILLTPQSLLPSAAAELNQFKGKSCVFVTLDKYFSIVWTHKTNNDWMCAQRKWKTSLCSSPEYQSQALFLEESENWQKKDCLTLSFSYFNIKYVFYICERIGKNYHIVISNISAECTTLKSSMMVMAFKWTEICALTKYVIDDHTITVSGAQSDIRIATVIYTFVPFPRKWIYF